MGNGKLTDDPREETMKGERMGGIVVRIILNGVALYVAANIVPGIRFTGNLGDLLIAGLLFGAMNAVIKPLLLILSFPLLIVSLGLFYFVVNAIILLLLAGLMPTLSISGLWAGLVGSLVISVTNILLHWALRNNSPS